MHRSDFENSCLIQQPPRVLTRPVNLWPVKATFHLTIPLRGQRARSKIQRNNYHHGNCGPSLTGEMMSVFLIFTQGTDRNVKNR